MIVARAGEEDTPAIAAPAALRPFMRFAKLPARALAVTRRALDADDGFRERVAESVEEEGVGRASWLFLTRPGGWEAELDGMMAGAEDAARQNADRRAEHDARRRLGAAQQAAQRADAAAAAARSEAAAAAASLADERRARQAAVGATATAEARSHQLAAEVQRLQAELASAAAARDTLLSRVATLESALEAARQRVASPAMPAPVAEPVAEPAVGLGAAPAPDVAAAVGPALAEAADAAARLAETLRTAVAALTPPAPSTPPGPVARNAVRPTAAPPAAAPVATRRPVPLPPAVYDDSLEAADHLVRVPGMVLVVDGYNVAKVGWPDLALAEQRRRLVDALVGLAARTGADVRVIFDGSELPMPGVVPSTAQSVRVSFSPPGVEADDVVIDLAAQLPAHRPVLVASNDRRVRLGAGRAGANVVTTEQLLALLRR